MKMVTNTTGSRTKSRERGRKAFNGEKGRSGKGSAGIRGRVYGGSTLAKQVLLLQRANSSRRRCSGRMGERSTGKQ